MPGNGLIMSLSEFRSLPQKQKLDCLFENQVKTLQLMKGYKLYYKFTYAVGAVLSIGMGILFKLTIRR